MRRSFVVLMIALFATIMYSQTTGKIKGVVLDEQGDPLPGANIIVEGTTWGAEADEEGYFYIIGVRAGTYTLKAEFIGYSPKEVKEVKVRVGLTTTQNFKLSSQEIELAELEAVVDFTEVKIAKDVTTSARTIDMGSIASMAVAEVDDVLKNTAGIKTDAEGEMHFRGGRAGEVNYVIDGISVGDPTGAKTNPVEINFANIESFNIQKGIPDAEYGDALSGSVNIVMKVGDQEKTSGHAKYTTDLFFGDSKLDYNKGEFSLSGPIPLPMSGLKPTYFLATDFASQNGYGRSYRNNGDEDGEFYEFDDYDLTGFGFKVPEKRENNFNIIFKTAYDLNETMKISTSYTKSRSHNYDFDYLYRYTPETASEQLADVTIFNINWKHTINQKSYYDLILSYYNREFENLPGGKKPDEFVLQDQIDGFTGQNIIDQTGRVTRPTLFDDFAIFTGQYNMDFISNGIRDGGDAEGYIDYNSNGFFDRENFTDSNGNKNWDDGEPFTDANTNGMYDGDVLFDSNGDGLWNYWEKGTSYSGYADNYLSPDIEIVEGYFDADGDGHYSSNIYRNRNNDFRYIESEGEPIIDGDKYMDTGEPFVDQKRFYQTDVDSTIYEVVNGYWDNGSDEYDIILKNGADDYTLTYPGGKTAFWARIDYIKQHEFYNWEERMYVDVNADSSVITLKYPGEYFADLKSTLGSNIQETPRYNDVYNKWDDGIFDEFEIYSSWRRAGSSTDETLLGWKTSDPNVKEFVGSYSVYRARIQDYENVVRIDSTLAFIEGYSTWLDNNSNGFYERSNQIIDDLDHVVDFNNNGRWDDNSGFLPPGTYSDDINYSLFDNTVIKLKGSYTNQLNRFHMLKTGFEYTANDLDYYKVTNPYLIYNKDVSEDDPYPARGEEKTQYQYKPKEFSCFLQDKMEFEDLVVNAGIRLDMRILDDKAVDYYEDQYDLGKIGYEETVNKYTSAVSPRFGISHSITENSKLFFSYGHLYQLPNYTQLFDPNTKETNEPLFGNMNLKYERNVQYELGIVNEIGDYLVDVTGYFKDIYDMINTKKYETGVETAHTWYNSDYGKSRGVEISVDRSLRDHYMWGISYTFSYAYGKSSSQTSNLDEEVYEVKESPLAWDERHTLNTYFTLMYQKNETLFDLPYTDDWTLNISTDFGSGKPFTPAREYFDYAIDAGDIENNSERMPWTSNTDMKFSKSFGFTGDENRSYGELRFEFNVFNLFNKTNVYSVYTDTGSWARRSDDFYENGNGQRDYLTDVWVNPENIAEKRHYSFGVSYAW